MDNLLRRTKICAASGSGTKETTVLLKHFYYLYSDLNGFPGTLGKLIIDIPKNPCIMVSGNGSNRY